MEKVRVEAFDLPKPGSGFARQEAKNEQLRQNREKLREKIGLPTVNLPKIQKPALKDAQGADQGTGQPTGFSLTQVIKDTQVAVTEKARNPGRGFAVAECLARERAETR